MHLSRPEETAMERKSVIEGIVFAAIAWAGALVSYPLIASFCGSFLAPKLIFAGACAIYLIWILSGARRTGRVCSIIAFLALALMASWGVGPYAYVFALSLGLCMLRSAMFHRSLVQAGLDLAVTVLAFQAWSAGYYDSYSFSKAIWLYFLVQSAWSAIPATAEQARDEEDSVNDRFDSACRRADKAVRQLFAC
jgi:hypothetical protein